MWGMCVAPECYKPVDAKGFCHTHYEWLRRNPDKYIEDYSAPRPKEFHGMTGSPEYRTWCSMISRCNNPNNIYYHRYGGRGIKVCDEWLNSFEAFYAYMGPRPKGLSIERIDNDKGYMPGNCTWVTQQKQIRNRGVSVRNTSGFTGVSWQNRSKRWHAELFMGGKRLYSRSFRSLDDAIEARKAAEKKYFI